MDNVIKVNLAAKGPVHTAPCYQYDQGRVIEFSGRDLSASFEVDFSNSPARSSITQIGTNNRITVPDQYFVSGEPVYVYLIAVGEDYAVTENPICIIPVLGRSARTNEEPTPSQESALDEAIAALNDAVEHSPKIEDGDWYTWDASAGAWVNTGVQAEGQDGFSPVVGIGKIGNRITLTITDAEGPHSVYLYDGTDGVGISSIEKTSTVGLVDTYTVTLTNGQTTTFTVTNGQNGTPGVSPEITVSEITGGHRITITDADHPSGQTVDVMDGENGDPGRGIVSVTKIGTSGLVDTYQITYTSGEPTTFTVTNGAPGTPGADGVSPAVSISSITGGHSVTITDKDHPTGQSFDVLDGTNGTDGTTFTPSVASNGDLSWSNDGGKTNPETVNIKGPSGAMLVESVTGATPSITGADNHRYVCGEVSTISISPPVSGIIDVVFECGSTPAVLTCSAQFPDNFDATVTGTDTYTLKANTRYEINIMDGYALVAEWAVSTP